MYKLLEETPNHGRAFAQAVKEVLRRETTWVEWKKGKNLGECEREPAAHKDGRPAAVERWHVGLQRQHSMLDSSGTMKQSLTASCGCGFCWRLLLFRGTTRQSG